MTTKAPSRLSDFDPVTLYDLPEPSPAGKVLTLKVRALAFSEVVVAMKRLPGEIPGVMDRKGTDYTLENLDALEHDMGLAEPVMREVCGRAVLEPALTFTDPPEPDRLPWEWLSIVNRTTLFRFVLKWSGFEGGAAEKIKSVAGVRKEGRGAGRVGTRAGRKTRR